MVVAIDGPSGVGKTTVAKATADALGVPHLDTGAFYRMATLLVLREGGDPADPDAVLKSLAGASIEFDEEDTTVDGMPVTEDLRSPDVTASVSTVAAHLEVRSAIVDLQRRWVRDRGSRAVVEGRDIGTVVFPDAETKVFLTADLRTRARRRARDPEVEGMPIEELEAMIEERDRIDSSRDVSPLRPADDAVVIDTSHLTVAEVVRRILDLAGAA